MVVPDVITNQKAEYFLVIRCCFRWLKTYMLVSLRAMTHIFSLSGVMQSKEWKPSKKYLQKCVPHFCFFNTQKWSSTRSISTFLLSWPILHLLSLSLDSLFFLLFLTNTIYFFGLSAPTDKNFICPDKFIISFKFCQILSSRVFFPEHTINMFYFLM